MPYKNSLVEVEQLSATREGSDNPKVTSESDSGGLRVGEMMNKGNDASLPVSDYVRSADDSDTASGSHVQFSLTSGATPISEEIPPMINEMVSHFTNVILHAILIRSLSLAR